MNVIRNKRIVLFLCTTLNAENNDFIFHITIAKFAMLFLTYKTYIERTRRRLALSIDSFDFYI